MLIAGCGGGSARTVNDFAPSVPSTSANPPTSSATTPSPSLTPSPAPTPPPSGPYQSNITAAAHWLAANAVAPDGAILYGSSQINPYYSNLAAIGLTRDPGSHGIVQRWMEWYIRHLNWPDQWGLHGTTYDYDYNNGAEVSHNNADSTDSYAGTFLSLAWAYFSTGDANAQSYVRTLSSQLDAIGQVLVLTQAARRPHLGQTRLPDQIFDG